MSSKLGERPLSHSLGNHKYQLLTSEEEDDDDDIQLPAYQFDEVSMPMPLVQVPRVPRKKMQRVNKLKKGNASRGPACKDDGACVTTHVGSNRISMPVQVVYRRPEIDIDEVIGELPASSKHIVEGCFA